MMDLRDLGLTHKDWLFDGCPIRSEEDLARFEALDWTNAFVDLGPSPAGNCGPYWHVGFKPGTKYAEEGTRHRLYPKIVTGKWAPLIYQACLECVETERKAKK